MNPSLHLVNLNSSMGLESLLPAIHNSCTHPVPSGPAKLQQLPQQYIQANGIRRNKSVKPEKQYPISQI